MDHSLMGVMAEWDTSNLIGGVALCAVVGAAGGVLGLWVCRQLWARWAHLPPGPWPLPVFGNLLSLGANPHLPLTKLQIQYGSTMMIYLGNARAVVLGSPEVVKEAMIKNGAALAGRPRTFSFEKASHAYQNVAFSEGQQWRKLRKLMVTEVLHKSRWASKLPIVLEEVLQAKAAMLEACEFDGGTARLEPKAYMRSISLNTVYQIVLSRRLDLSDFSREATDMRDLSAAFRVKFDCLGAGTIEDYVPLLKHLPSPKMWKLSWALGVRDRILLQWIEERRESGPGTAGPTDVLDALMAVQEEHQLTDVQLMLVVDDLVSGGTDTAGVTAEWLLLLMAAHPSEQRAVQEELDAVFGAGIPDEIDRSKLPVLTAAIMEAMRLKPVGPLLFPRRTVQDTTVGGFRVPANTQVIINNALLTTSPSLWKDPAEFRPQRFLEEESHLRLQGGETRATVDAYKFIPFGVGQRFCPGQELAEAELFVIASHMLHGFRWLPDPSAPVNLEGTLGLTYEPVLQKLLCIPRHSG